MDNEPHKYRSNSVAFKITKNLLHAIPTELPAKSNDLKLPDIKRKPINFIDKPPIPKALRSYISQKSDRNHLSSMRLNRSTPSQLSEDPTSFQNLANSSAYSSRFHETTAEDSIPEELKENKLLIPQDEIKELRKGLKRKWRAVKKEVSLLESNMDEEAIKLIEMYERELEQLRRDMRLLDKDYVFVDTTN